MKSSSLDLKQAGVCAWYERADAIETMLGVPPARLVTLLTQKPVRLSAGWLTSSCFAAFIDVETGCNSSQIRVELVSGQQRWSDYSRLEYSAKFCCANPSGRMEIPGKLRFRSECPRPKLTWGGLLVWQRYGISVKILGVCPFKRLCLVIVPDRYYFSTFGVSYSASPCCHKVFDAYKIVACL